MESPNLDYKTVKLVQFEAQIQEDINQDLFEPFQFKLNPQQLAIDYWPTLTPSSQIL